MSPTNGTPPAGQTTNRITPHLDFISTKAKRLPNRLILHATEGFGKTSFAAHAPDPVFLMTRHEDGLLTLINSGRLPDGIAHIPEPADTYLQVNLFLSNLACHQHPFRTLVIDTMNGVEKLIHEQVCRDHFSNDWGEGGFTGYDRGARQAVPLFIDFLAHLNALRDMGMSIILLAHTQVKLFRNPTGTDYDRYSPQLHKDTWSEAHKWADMILFGSQHVNVTTSRKKDTKGKAQAILARTLHTERQAAFDAKNRHGLPATIPCGNTPAEAWSNFVKELKRPPAA